MPTVNFTDFIDRKAFTSAQEAKLNADLNRDHGVFTSLADILAIASPQGGDYATLDLPGEKAVTYFYDVDSTNWTTQHILSDTNKSRVDSLQVQSATATKVIQGAGLSVNGPLLTISNGMTLNGAQVNGVYQELAISGEVLVSGSDARFIGKDNASSTNATEYAVFFKMADGGVFFVVIYNKVLDKWQVALSNVAPMTFADNSNVVMNSNPTTEVADIPSASSADVFETLSVTGVSGDVNESTPSQTKLTTEKAVLDLVNEKTADLTTSANIDKYDFPKTALTAGVAIENRTYYKVDTSAGAFDIDLAPLADGQGIKLIYNDKAATNFYTLKCPAGFTIEGGSDDILIDDPTIRVEVYLSGTDFELVRG